MKTLNEILTGLKYTVEEIKTIEELMAQNDLDYDLVLEFTEKELQTHLGLTVGKAKKLKAKFKELTEVPEVKTEVALPTLPTEFTTFKVVVTGNTTINSTVINDFLNFGIMYSLGVEKIGQNLLELINRRSDETDEPNSVEISKITGVVAKFKNVDSSIAHLLGTDIGFLQDRHIVFKDIKTKMLPTIIQFFNEALQFRLNLASIDNLILSKLSSQKIGENIDASVLNIAAQDLIVTINKSLKGNNHYIVKASIELYTELFELLEDKELLKFLNCRDTRDLLQKCGVTYTPKDVAVLKQLPLIIYQILHILESEAINDPKILIAYLQTVWANARILDWTKLNIFDANLSQSMTNEVRTLASVNTEEEVSKLEKIMVL